jgi:Tfp pilus assembly protein PilN
VIRINLLPPEIGRKRRDEERWRWVILGAIVAGVLLAGVFIVLQLQVSARQGEVAAVKQQAEGLQQSAARFQVFQEKQADLENRKRVADTALAGRLDWSKLLSEVALVLPPDIYVLRLGLTEPKAAVVRAGAGSSEAAQVGKIALDGRALDFPNDVPDLGYKSIAKLLVRLADLDQVMNVWLTQSTKPAAPVTTAGGTAPTVEQYIIFAMSADITSTPVATAGATGVPAPPTP